MRNGTGKEGALQPKLFAACDPHGARLSYRPLPGQDQPPERETHVGNGAL